MDALELAQKSDNPLIFMWKYFLYNYFNGWFILVVSLIVLYFVVLRQRYMNETEEVDISASKTKNKEEFTVNDSLIKNTEPEPTQEDLFRYKSSNKIDEMLAEQIRLQIDLAVADSADAIYNIVIQYINSLDYSQSNNRRVDIRARKDELVPRIRNILEQKADILYAELPKQEGKELKKYRIQDILEKYVAKKMYLNLKADKADLERKIAEYNNMRDKYVNYGGSNNPEELNNFRREMLSRRMELDIKNQIFQILITTNMFDSKNPEEESSDLELGALYDETSKGIESFLDSAATTISSATVPLTTQPNTYRYDPNTRYDGFYLDDIKQRETDSTAKYGKAYQDYLDAKASEELKVDPVELLSRVENNIIRFLETVKEDNSSHAEEMKNNNTDTINPVNFKTDTIGKYLLDSKTQASLIEGFEDGATPTSSNTIPAVPLNTKNKNSKNNNIKNKTGAKKDIISSLLDYGYELLDWGYGKIAGDSYFSSKIEEITQDNNQMMTVGFLFVLGSIILLMIEFTS